MTENSYGKGDELMSLPIKKTEYQKQKSTKGIFLKKTIRGILTLGLLSSVCHGKILMDPGQLIDIKISKEGMTRISIENDEISNVIVYPKEFQDNAQNHNSGHLFVVADDLTTPLSITLVTKRGLVQDLRIIPTQKKPEPVILRFEDEETKKEEIQKESTKVLSNFVQGLIPSGFYTVAIKETSRTRGDLSAIVDRVYQNGQFRVLVYTIKNECDREITLDNRLMWDAGDLALAFDKSHLGENQSAKLYVVQKI